MPKYYKPNNSTILYLNSSFNCYKSSSITLTVQSGGTNYSSAPSIVITPASGDNGYGAVATATISGGAINNISITNNGQNYNALPTITTSGGGNPGVITGYSGLSGGTGYTTAPLVSVTGGGGSGFAAYATLTGNSVSSITITNGGSNYSSTPTIVFTPTNGGSGASATATVLLGTSAVINASFVKTYKYTWNVPDIVINDLGKLSAINIVSTGFNNTTPYIYRINNILYDSRDSFFSDYGNPILSIAQNTNVCSYGSLGGTNFAIVLSPQVIRQIIISVDDSITSLNTGQNASINFIIALEIEEYDVALTEIDNIYKT